MIASINYPKLHELDNVHPETRAAMLHSHGWCNNFDSRFEDIFQRGPISRRSNVKLPKPDVEILLKLEKSKLFDDLLCACNIFTVIEQAKARRRLIVEPLLNDLITKHDLLGIELPSRSVIRHMASQKYFAQLDASSFFDQFGVNDEVKKYLGFAIGKQKLAYCTLPMGFRPSCDVAQTTAEFLLDFAHPGVLCSAYIDNFFFAGNDRVAVSNAISTFKSRCAVAGVILNDDEMDGNLEAPEIDVLGEHYSRVGSHFTRSLTKTSVEKLHAALALVDYQTHSLISRRQVAAVYGILFFASAVIEVSPAPFFYAMRDYREMAASTSNSEWQNTADRLTNTAVSELREWISQCARNLPVPLTKLVDPSEVSLDIVCDASAWGVGAIAWQDGQAREFARPWSAHESALMNLKSSVVAEPRAVQQAAIAFINPQFSGVVRIHTDHRPLVFAAARGYASCFWYNQLLINLKSIFPKTTFIFVFVPGAQNPADFLSRGWIEGGCDYGSTGLIGSCAFPRGNVKVNGCSMCSSPLPPPYFSSHNMKG